MSLQKNTGIFTLNLTDSMITNYYIMIGKEVQYRGRLLKSSHLKDLFCKQIMVEKNKKIPLKSTISEGFWSEMGDSNSRHLAPKPMSEPSVRTLVPSLALSVAPTVPLWNSIGLFISATAFGFWDLYGMEFCILKVLPTGIVPGSGCFLPQRAAQKLRRINKEISAMTKKQQADLDDSQPAERRWLFDVLPFGSNTCSFA